jgi:hypothetical protein
VTATTLADRHRERATAVMDSVNIGASIPTIGEWIAVRNAIALALAAVERETIERAAKVCEQEAREHAKLHDPHLEDVAYSCAALVRALADRKEG